MKKVEVVAALIISKGKVFATQRGYGPWKDYWEFPGGKIESGETPQQALEREISEELDTKIVVGDLFSTIEYDYPEFHLSMGCYLCSILEGHLTLLEHEEARWLSASDLSSVDWLPADYTIIPMLSELLTAVSRSESDEHE